MAGVKGIGRRQKTAAERALEGIPARAHHHEQPVQERGEPARPSFLNELESALWEEIAALLRNQGRLTTDSGPWLLETVTAGANWLRWRELSNQSPLTFDKFSVDGAGVEPKAHPAHQQERLARESYLGALKEGGLTPASISRVVMPKKPDEQKQGLAGLQARTARKPAANSPFARVK